MLCPILSGYLSDVSIIGRKSKRQAFNDMVWEVQCCFDDGSVSNVVYNFAKVVFNNAIDDAYLAIRDEHVSGQYRSLPVTVQKFADMFNIIYLHSVPSLIKRAEKIKMEEHPFRMQMLAFLHDALPLANIMEYLKGKVVKRQPKPVEEQKIGYRPPVVSTEAEKMVVALLEWVTETAYTKLVVAITDHMHTELRAFVEAVKGDAKLTSYDFFIKNRKRFPDHLMYEMADKVVGLTDISLIAVVFWGKATAIADEYRTNFVHKNFRKIASIIEAKGGYSDAKVLDHTADLIGLSGTFMFKFADGSSFATVNKVVYSVSILGTPFNRFPLTFHDVVMPDGTKMGQPSQERMNTIFVKG
jgi:hypothetical protein